MSSFVLFITDLVYMSIVSINNVFLLYFFGLFVSDGRKKIYQFLRNKYPHE